MKKNILSVIIFATVFFAACTNENQQSEQAAQKQPEQKQEPDCWRGGRRFDQS